MEHLTREGIGCQKHQAEPISLAKECELWKKRMFGDKTGHAGCIYITHYYTIMVSYLD